MDLTKILESTISADKDELESAQKYLEAAAQSNLPQFLVALAMELADPTKSQVARMAAGLQLKNQLTSKDSNVKIQHQQRWLSLEDSVKSHIKTLTLQTLGTEVNQPSIAPQCIAAIASSELPNGHWLDLINTLVQNVTSTSSTEALKQQTLEAMGYICQDIEPQYLAGNSNEILTAIVQGMRKEEPSNKVRFAATTALLNSLEFTKANFENDNERHFIMQVVCEATQCEDSKVKVTALQNLVKVMSLYYQHMETYMAPALFAITLDAMRSPVDEVCLQGIEFWSTVCDEEMDLAIEAAEAQEQGKTPERISRFYAKGALQHLIQFVLMTLTKQEEFDDEDDWNPCKASGVCLMLFAQCCENDILQHVLPFVKENIKHTDWRFRDAAVMAFGSMLEGPEPKELEPIVVQAMPVLIELMKDPSVIVRDTVAWTLGRICELIPQAAINDGYLLKLLEAMMEGLDAEPRVAANVCWAFSSLCEAAYEVAPVGEEEEEPSTYCLSQLFPQIVKKILDTTDRPDAMQANLRSAAYEAVMELIKNSPKDCYEIVQSTTLLVLERLQQVIHMDTVASDRAQYNDLQSLLCATLQSVLRKVRQEDAKQISDPIMSALLSMFSSSTSLQTSENEEQVSGVQEDAYMAVGTLVEVVGAEFIKYMVAFKPVLIVGLKNHAEYQVCTAAVGLVGDICRSLSGNVLPFADEFMQCLLENLADENVHRTVKPQILSVFGDMALAIGPNFTKYLEMVLGTLLQASQAQVDKTDYDMVDYLNELREGCLEAYTGIVQGLKGDGETPNPDVNLLQPHVMNIIGFIELCADDADHTDSIVTCACGLVGDLCAAFGSSIQPLLDKPIINELLSEGRRSKTHKTKSLATWATKELRKLKQMVS